MYTLFTDFEGSIMRKWMWYLSLLGISTFSLQIHASGESVNNELEEQQEVMVDVEALGVDPAKYNKFVSNLEDSQIAVVDVIGMVCDFCARGIAKTFKKDKSVLSIDIDLSRGKVLIAYDTEKEVDFEEIKHKIQANGQNAISMLIVNI